MIYIAQDLRNVYKDENGNLQGDVINYNQSFSRWRKPNKDGFATLTLWDDISGTYKKQRVYLVSVQHKVTNQVIPNAYNIAKYEGGS